MSKPQAYGRHISELPPYSGTYTGDPNAEYVWVDEEGNPIITRDLGNYDTSKRTRWVPPTKSPIFEYNNQVMSVPGITAQTGTTPQQTFYKNFEYSLRNPANPYSAAKTLLGLQVAIAGGAAGFAAAPVATTVGFSGDFLGQVIGNQLSDKVFNNPDRPFKLNIDTQLTPREAMQYGTGFVLGGTMGIDAEINPILRQSINRYSQNVLKRGIETAMRTSADADPIPAINTGLKAYYNTEIPTNLRQIPRFFGNLIKGSTINPRAKAITKYVLTGKNRGQGYNTLSTREVINPFTGIKEPYKYSGLYDDENFYPTSGYGDVIDAYLYRRSLDPRIGIKSTEGLGMFDSDIPEKMHFYISKNYSDKSGDIPSYTLNSSPETKFIPENLQQAVTIKSNISSDSHPVFNRQTIPLNLQSKSGFNKSFNSGGHRISLGELPNGTKVFRREDIWKFRPEDYNKRWNVNSPLLNWGLRTVDKMGTPIITRTPWMLL